LRRSCILCLCSVAGPFDLCRACLDLLPEQGLACERCASPLLAGRLCGACVTRPPPFSRARVPFLYAYPLDALIKAGKFSNRLDYLSHLGRILADRLQYTGVHPPECLVPVPLHWRRLITRGYNQALELARPLAHELGVPLCTGVCRRSRYTKPQTELSARDRVRNVRSAFRITRALPYRHIALVDDVFTTGSTARELARVLLSAGAVSVEVWALARAALGQA
jgi:ComF family protein